MELRELLPGKVMDLDFAEAPAGPPLRAERDAISITPQELEVRLRPPLYVTVQGSGMPGAMPSSPRRRSWRCACNPPLR